MYPRKELNYLADDLANRSEWVDILFTALHYRMEMEQQEASELLENMILDIVNGDTLDVLMKKLEMCAGRKIDIALHTEMWIVLTGLMLEKELPILKGRSRMQYAEEKNVSAWSVGMLDGLYSIKDEKRCHMYEFSTEIQENMFYADNYGESEKIEQLLEYQENNDICSEEFLYLLAKACITFGETESAERLIGKLKKSSSGGKKAAERLQENLAERYDVVDDEPEWNEVPDVPWIWDEPEVQQPVVRQTPKIGRNDPCPCGSGKKYKKCCGR